MCMVQSAHNYYFLILIFYYYVPCTRILLTTTWIHVGHQHGFKLVKVRYISLLPPKSFAMCLFLPIFFIEIISWVDSNTSGIMLIQQKLKLIWIFKHVWCKKYKTISKWGLWSSYKVSRLVIYHPNPVWWVFWNILRSIIQNINPF